MAVISSHPVFLVLITISLQFSSQSSVSTSDSELPVNITLPKPEIPEIISEEYEPDRNRTSILQWLINAAGFATTTEIPVIDPTPTNCPACTCGLTNKNHRIVGGQETAVNEYPWMTLLKYRGSFYCGGTLICNKYVLTAGHCVSGFMKDRITAHFQVHDRNNIADIKMITRKIKYIIKHSKYDSRTYDNDIALLKLDEEVRLEQKMRPACLPELGKSFTGHPAIVTGWGAIKEGGSLASKLQEVSVNIMSNDNCKKTGYGESRITKNMLCAGFAEGKKDSCQGDSGGPLHFIEGTIHSVVGVVSWGDGCAQANYPGVYTRVNRYITWIKSNTKDCCFC